MWKNGGNGIYALRIIMQGLYIIEKKDAEPISFHRKYFFLPHLFISHQMYIFALMLMRWFILCSELGIKTNKIEYNVP